MLLQNYFTFSFNLNFSTLQNFERWRQQLSGWLRYVDLHGLAGGLHSGGGVNTVAEKTVSGHLQADYARHHCPRMDANSNSQVLSCKNILVCEVDKHD